MQDNLTIIIDILTKITAIAAIGVSLWSVHISKKNLIASAITSNRMEWIKIVRSLTVDFLKEYEKKGIEKTELINIYEELMLYFNATEKVYFSFVEALKDCLDETEEYSIQKSCAVILGAQTVLDSAWVRMKREAGFSKKFEKSIARFVHKRLNVDADANSIPLEINWTDRKRQREKVQ